MAHRDRFVTLGRSLGLVLILLGSFGCATYSDRVDRAHQRVQAGDLPGAIEEMNDVLGVSSREDMPRSWGSDRQRAI